MSRLPNQAFANPALPLHHALALEAAACAERVLPLFEQAYPHDSRPRYAVATLRKWVQGQASMLACRQAALAAHAAARAASQPAAVAAARAAGQAAAVAHMYTHAPHVAAYVAKATAFAT
ncbi:putative immunity protein [Hymenobacter sp.]|uniref:putative immunity protein n=1 Tax=Hymenobacter sp. TaxID=1898978 RepID=UPI002ED9144A